MAVALFRFAGAVGGERDATLEFRRDRGLVLLQMQLRSADETVVLRSFTETGADEESFPLPRILVPSSAGGRFDVLFQVDDTAVTFLHAQDMTVIHAFRHRAPFARASVKVGGECRLTRVIQLPSATARSVDVAIPASMWQREGWAFRVTQDGEAPIFTAEWQPAGPRLHCCHSFRATGVAGAVPPTYTATSRTRVPLSAELPAASEPSGASQAMLLTLVFDAVEVEDGDEPPSAPAASGGGAVPAFASAKRASRRVSIVSRSHGTLCETIVPWTPPAAAAAASAAGAGTTLAPAAASVAFLDIPHHVAAAVVGAGGTSALTAAVSAAGKGADAVPTGTAAALASLATPPPTPAGKVPPSASATLPHQPSSHDVEVAPPLQSLSADAPSTPRRPAGHAAPSGAERSSDHPPAADASTSSAVASVAALHASDAAAASGHTASSLSSLSSSRPRTPPHAPAPANIPHFAPPVTASAPASRFVSPRQSARSAAAAPPSRQQTARVTPGDFPYSCILDILHGNMETISGLSAAELDAWLVWLGHAKAAVKAQRLTTLLQEQVAAGMGGDATAAGAYDGDGASDHGLYVARSDGDRHMSASGSFSSLSMHAHTPILTASAYRASLPQPAIEVAVPDAVASGGVGGAGATTILASYFSSPPATTAPAAQAAPLTTDGDAGTAADSSTVNVDAVTADAASPRPPPAAAGSHGHRASAADTRAAAVL